MRHCKRGHHRDQRAEAAERDHQAEQEQQVVGPVQDVEEAELDEPASGLMPSGIQVDQSRIANELIGANGAAGRKETENGYHSRGQSLEPWVNRNRGSVRLNRVLEQHVERYLVPEDVGAVRQLRASD